MNRSPLLLAVTACFTICCRHVPVSSSAKLDPEAMEQLASSLVYLTAAVEAVIYDGTLPAGLGDSEIVAFATKHNPAIAAPLASYRIRIDRGERDAVLLVCTADSSRGLVEDATCTPGPDRHLWEESAPKPCEFVDRVAEVCPKP